MWLSLEDFKGRIRLPNSVSDITFLEPFLNNVIEDDLPDLIGTARLSTLREWLTVNPPSEQQPTDNSTSAALYRVIVPYLVYSTLSQYVLFGTVNVTPWGLNIKENADTKAINDVQRAELQRFFRDKASRKAQIVLEYINRTTTFCDTESIGSSLTFSSARGKKTSLF